MSFMVNRGKKKTDTYKQEFIAAGVDRLRLAICEQAIADYKQALRGKKPQYKNDCEKFFRSAWYKELMDIDGELVIFQVGKQVAEELCIEGLVKEEMITTYEAWVLGCEVNHTKVYRLEGEGDTGVYKTQEQYEYKNNYYSTTPLYHVWIRGKSVGVLQDYNSAIELYYKKLKQKEREEKANE